MTDYKTPYGVCSRGHPPERMHLRRGARECQSCQSESVGRSQRKARAAAAEAKLLRGCAECGYRDHPDALEFDHIVPRLGARWVPPQTMPQLARVLGDPNIRVLCANCHAIRSQADKRVVA